MAKLVILTHLPFDRLFKIIRETSAAAQAGHAAALQPKRRAPELVKADAE
jgi:hypothetical protein